MQKFDFSYDNQNDDLFLCNPKSKSRGSVELGDLVLDYNTKKELVGIKITNASVLIKELVNEHSASIKRILQTLLECKVDIKPQNNFLIVRLCLSSKYKEISPILFIPHINKSSPALAYT